MEENRFDPLQFIGFLLISGILMFWFYDNQSNMIENQEEIVDDSQIEVVEQPSNIVNSSYNDYEDNDEFNEEIIVLENSNILLEISTKGAEIKKLLLKDFYNYNDDPLFLIDDNKSIFSFNIPVGRNSKINSQDLNYTAEIIDENLSVKLKAEIDSRSELELSFFLSDNSSIVDFELDIIDNTNSNYENVELIWGRDSFRNSKSIDYENRYTALSYGFENNKDSYLSVAGITNKVIDNVNWVSFREHFFSSILILNNESNQVEISSEDLSGNDALDKKFTKRFLANIPLSLGSNSQLSFSMYYGPTDYETLKEYNLNLENSVQIGWGIFGWLNRFIFFPLFSFLTNYFSYGLSIILMTIIVKVAIAPLTYKSYESQVKMRILKPELEVINEKFKDDPMKLSLIHI